MKKVYKAVTGIIVLAISPTIFATDVGIIPDNNCPQGSESITIYMDDEDTHNESKLTGWVGATSSLTKFKFCRVNGDQFKPLSNGEAYAVLKLSDSCPNNSIEFSRFFDNEDDRNNNQTTGNIYPNIVNRNTTLKFCYFKGRASGMSSFPNIGINYGVFSPSNFALSIESGQIYTDDQDDTEKAKNANGLNTHGHPEIRRIINGGKNTILRVNKVKTFRYPADSNFTYISTRNIPKPAYLGSYIEPNFGTRVTRITDRQSNNEGGHPATKTGPAWNSDMSIIKLNYKLYDAKTFEKKNLSDLADNALSGRARSDVRWSKIDAHTIYTMTSGNELTKVVFNDQYTDANVKVLHNFGKVEYEKVSFGEGEGNLDNNDEIVLSAKKPNSDTVYAILYDLRANQIKWRHSVPDVRWGRNFDWISISPKGNYIVVNDEGGENGAIHVYDRNLNNQRKIDNVTEHGDLGVDQQGNEVYVQFHTYGTSEGDKLGIWSMSVPEALQLTRINARVGCFTVSHCSRLVECCFGLLEIIWCMPDGVPSFQGEEVEIFHYFQLEKQ